MSKIRINDLAESWKSISKAILDALTAVGRPPKRRRIRVQSKSTKRRKFRAHFPCFQRETRAQIKQRAPAALILMKSKQRSIYRISRNLEYVLKSDYLASSKARHSLRLPRRPPPRPRRQK